MRARAAALVLMACLAVSGCARMAEPPDSLTAERASDQMQGLVRETMRVAGGEWTSASDGPAPDPCTTSIGGEGVSFSWDQDADGPSDPAAVMRRVDRAWRNEGFTTRTQSVERADGETLHRVGSGGRDVDSIQFNATTDHMSINVQSLCGAGDVDDFIDSGD